MSSILPINVEDLLSARGVESARIEFKGSWNTGPTALQVLHTICAFANDLQNLNGGYIVIGVEEDSGVAKFPPRGLPAGEIDQIQRWIRGQCNRIDPPVQCVPSPEVVDDHHILVVWVPGSDNRYHRAPESLAKGAQLRPYVRLGSETVLAKGDLERQLVQLTSKVPFDDRRALGVSLESLREGRVREFLADVRSGLVEERDAHEVYRRMRISSRANGQEVPRNVGLLFFSDDPEEWFPGARVEVVQFAGDSSGNVIEERVFRGAVGQHLRDAISYLRGFSTQHFEKLTDQPEVEGWVSYPLPALDESLVNAVYHRSYEGPAEPTKVYLYPDRIEIISYPGPVPGIEPNHFARGASIPPVPARNRRIGELLKELRLAEGRGTGIPKVYRVMEQNGSPQPRFEFDQGRSYFRAILPAHPEYVAISALRDSAHLRAIGDESGALERLRQAYEDQPFSATLAGSLISAFSLAGAFGEAERVFHRFMEQEVAAGRAKVISAMSAAYLDSGDEGRARGVLDRLPETLSHREAIDAAILERRAGRHQHAHRLFDKAGDAVQSDARALHEFAQTKIRLTADLRRGPRDPYKDEARNRLFREARAMLERVLQMDVPPARRAWAWFDLGRALRWLDLPMTDIRHAFEEAIRLLPAEERFQQELRKLDDPSP